MLDWAVPEECTNLWFDGWVMLKSGIGEDAAKKQAAGGIYQLPVPPGQRSQKYVLHRLYIGYCRRRQSADL